MKLVEKQSSKSHKYGDESLEIAKMNTSKPYLVVHIRQ
jgi:hypothetical protein